MTALDLSSPVAVVGTGTMGQGIAQVALVAGHPVRLYDAARAWPARPLTRSAPGSTGWWRRSASPRTKGTRRAPG